MTGAEPWSSDEDDDRIHVYAGPNGDRDGFLVEAEDVPAFVREVLEAAALAKEPDADLDEMGRAERETFGFLHGTGASVASFVEDPDDTGAYRIALDYPADDADGGAA